MPLPAFESSSTRTLTLTSCFLSTAIVALLSDGPILIKRGGRKKPRGRFCPRGCRRSNSSARVLDVSRLVVLAAEALDLDGLVLLHLGGPELLLQDHLLVELAHHHGLFVRRLRPLHLGLVRALEVNFVEDEVDRRL